MTAQSQRKSAEKPQYFFLPVKSILDKCDSARVPFDWTINPYRGCEFGCVYCYARYTHEYMELDGGEFPIKRIAGDVLQVSADIFRDGHDKLAAALLVQQFGESDWSIVPFTAVSEAASTAMASTPLRINSASWLFCCATVPSPFRIT